MSKPFIDVAVGIILRPDGQLLLGQRPTDKAWPGWWELPGGKIEPGESVQQALARELMEEVGIRVTESMPWVTYVHEYPKTIVRLAFCKVTAWEGEPQGLENQALAWVDPRGPLSVGPVLPATEPPLRWLNFPDRYLVSHIGSSDRLSAWLERLDAALARGPLFVQFREPAWQARAHQDTEEARRLQVAFEAVLKRCRAAGASCLVNAVHPESWWSKADGVHLRASDVEMRRAAPPTPALTAASVHNEEECRAAADMNVDFMVMGHVLATPSHPAEPAIGWDGFQSLAQHAGRPVYAIGGQSAETMATAKSHGAHGIAFVRGDA
jgi:Thiamine monophosphate synthase